ncbi:LysM peptidoglycan-binding domain-containing protein [Nocardioides pantholopis]|uniref:LysM peptidoglycan-binding domain-containing protein n=1 Tax=Nocardioides pantholopis TaxID=2483798 RepID=UPI000FDA4E3D|nr:LysM peptidoglycan-binding domain-containing protein [Nocardioides pantholopis]
MSTMSHSLVRPAVRPAVAQPRAVRSGAAGVRLTRRGRAVVLLAAVAVMLAVVVFWSAGSVASPESGAAEATTVVTVGTGQTLWGIAADLAADGDVRSTMREIERLNALESSMLVAGQRLRVPQG